MADHYRALAGVAEAAVRRRHRSAHRVLWILFALAVAIGLATALILRAPLAAHAAAAAIGAGP